MFGKNPVYELELNYLRKVHPHHWWHYGLIITALLFASISMWHGFDYTIIWEQGIFYRQIANTVSILIRVMTFPILSSYWVFQFRIMQSSVVLTKHDWQKDAPDTLIGMVSQSKLTLAKIRAVLTHHRIFLILMCLALLGLSWGIAQFLLFWGSYSDYPDRPPPITGRSILEYVGAIRAEHFPVSERIFYVPIMGISLFILIFTNSLLSTSIGLWAGQRGRSILVRLLLIAVIFGIFMSLYTLRGTPEWTCFRGRMTPEIYWCQIQLQARIIDSIQAISLSFVDSGASMVTGLHGCGGISFRFGSYQGRHLLAVIATVISQLALSAFFLRQTIRQSSKKKK